MTTTTAARGACAAIRRHPARAAAICLLLLAASALYGSTLASASPIPTLAVSAAALRAAPAPHVLLFDNDLPTPRPAGRVAALTLGGHVTGCDSDYGTADQCVPWAIPGSTRQAKCAWLRANGFGPLPVAGINRQHLAENGRGYVCGSGA